ncbi:MAG TPA: anaerobic ribonucleoside-triphosphate reductase activating protein [Rhizomicrobium sp.]
MPELRIGGLSRLSSCDWPGELVATVFCQGCSWRCPYCHNPDLLPATGKSSIPWEEVRAFLATRRNLLDAVVFSGGEPLLQQALSEAMRDASAMGFKIGLHTGGAVSSRFAEVLPLVDWVGFDVKAPFDDYARITGIDGSGRHARESLIALLASGVANEVRTTVHPRLLGPGILDQMAHELAGLGVVCWVLQAFRGRSTTSLAPEPYEEDMLGTLKQCIAQVEWR